MEQKQSIISLRFSFQFFCFQKTKIDFKKQGIDNEIKILQFFVQNLVTSLRLIYENFFVLKQLSVAWRGFHSKLFKAFCFLLSWIIKLQTLTKLLSSNWLSKICFANGHQVPND